MRKFGITYFPSLYKTEGEYYELNIQELKQLLSKKYEVNYKDNAPGFIAGRCENNLRTGDNKLISRSCLVLDFDNILNLDNWYNTINYLFNNYLYFLYTSFSHSEKVGKVRLVIPLKEDVNPKKYEDFLNNTFCYSLNKEIASSVDKTSYQAKRFMFLHSSKIGDNKGFYYCNDKDMLFDISWYPEGDLQEKNISLEYKEYEVLYKDFDEASDYFNSLYKGQDIYKVIKDEIYIKIFNSIDIMWYIKHHLNKIYTNNYKNRFRYYKSNSGLNGAVVYNNSLFSNHNSDPACDGHKHGCFDLLVIHKCDNNYIAGLNFVKRLLNYKLYQ